MIDYTQVPKGHRHQCVNEIKRGWFGKYKIIICSYCLTESYWRWQIANEIEDYRTDKCRCEQTLEKNCEFLIKAADIARGQK